MKIPAMAMLLVLCLAFPAELAGSTSREPTLEQRYETAIESWRTDLVLYILTGQETGYVETTNRMFRFTAVTTAFLDLRHPDPGRVRALHYRNLENLTRLEELHLLVSGFRRSDPAHGTDFLAKYGLAVGDFADYASFATAYERVMDTWRVRLEAALRSADRAVLRELAVDVRLLRFAVSGLILLPGRAAAQVPRLVVIEKDLRAAALRLRLHEEALIAAGIPDPPRVAVTPGSSMSVLPDGAPQWRVTVNDPEPGEDIPLPPNTLSRAEWWPGLDPFDGSISLTSGYGEPGDRRRREWSALYTLLARLSGTEPENGISGIVARRGADIRIVGYYLDIQEDRDGREIARRKVYFDRLIGGLVLTREGVAAFCRWRYGALPW